MKELVRSLGISDEGLVRKIAATQSKLNRVGRRDSKLESKLAELLSEARKSQSNQ